MASLDALLLGRFASLESDVPAAGGFSDSLEVGQVVDEDGAQLDGENLVEGDLIAASEDADVIDEGSAETDELIETTEALESYLAAARHASKQGGWTTQEATAYHVGIDIAMKKLGADGSAIVPSLESFGSSRERINATASVENRLTEALRKIWEAIKRAVNKVYVFVKKWYLKILDGASRLKKRAEAIRKKAENTTGSKKENKIRTGVLGQLHIAKAAPSGDKIKSALDDVAGMVDGLTSTRLTGEYGNACESVIEKIQEIADGKLKDAAAPTDAASGATTAAVNAMKTVNDSLGKVTAELGLTKTADNEIAKRAYAGAPQGTVVLTTDEVELPGGKTVLVIGKVDTGANATNAENAKNVTAALKYAYKVTFIAKESKKVEIDESKEIDTLDTGAVISICDGVINFADKVIDYKKGFEQYEKKTKELLSKADKIKGKDSKSGDNDAEAANGAIARTLATGVGAAMRNMGTSITNVINYGMNLSRAALVYANSSLNQYKD